VKQVCLVHKQCLRHLQIPHQGKSKILLALNGKKLAAAAAKTRSKIATSVMIQAAKLTAARAVMRAAARAVTRAMTRAMTKAATRALPTSPQKNLNL
jgi:hypothetical protein